VIQYNPDFRFEDFFYGLYAKRQSAVLDAGCAPGFGGETSECRKLVARLVPLFRDPGPTPPEFRAGPGALVIKDSDPVWTQRGGWVWSTPPLYQNSFVRMVKVPSVP
jgi:hypothetical protein